MPVSVNYSYKDTSGIVHGPFSAEQMMYWYKNACFTENLEVIIQPDNEQHISTKLAQLIDVNGNNEPFLAVSGPLPQKTTIKSECCSEEAESTSPPNQSPLMIKAEIADPIEENQSVPLESVLQSGPNLTKSGDDAQSTESSEVSPNQGPDNREPESFNGVQEAVGSATPHGVVSLPSRSENDRYNLRPTIRMGRALPLLGKTPETDQFLSLKQAEWELFQLESLIKNMPESFLNEFPVKENFCDQLCGHCGQFLNDLKSVLHHVINYQHLSKIDKLALTEEDVNFWKTTLEEIFTWGRQKVLTKVVEKPKTPSEGLSAHTNSNPSSLKRPRPLLSQPPTNVAEAAPVQPVCPSFAPVARPDLPNFTNKFVTANYFSEKITVWRKFENIAFDVLSSWSFTRTCDLCQETTRRPSSFFRHLFTNNHCIKMSSNYSRKDLDEWWELIQMVENFSRKVRKLPLKKQKHELLLYKKSLIKSTDTPVLAGTPMNVFRCLYETPNSPASPESTGSTGIIEVVKQGIEKCVEMLGFSTPGVSLDEDNNNCEKVPEKKPRLAPICE